MNKQKYIMLFNILERSDLQDSLNKVMYEYDVHDIDVWNDQDDYWNAKVIYSYKDDNGK